MNQRLMRPKRRFRRAIPSIAITTPGELAVTESFYVGQMTEGTVFFSDGSASGEVTFFGNASTAETTPSGYSLGSPLGPSSLPYNATMPGAMPDMVMTGVSEGANGPGIVQVTQGLDGVSQILHLSFDGATGGTLKINGSVVINWDDGAAAVEAALEGAIGSGVSVSGSAGEFDVTYDDLGPYDLLLVTENLLTK